jgi:hypothetical protein
MCVAKNDVRFSPESDRESGHPQTAMSALPLKADMCSAVCHVCFATRPDHGEGSSGGRHECCWMCRFYRSKKIPSTRRALIIIHS